MPFTCQYGEKKQSFFFGEAYPIFSSAMSKFPVKNEEVCRCPVLPATDDNVIRCGMCICLGNREGKVMKVLSVFKYFWSLITFLFCKQIWDD